MKIKLLLLIIYLSIRANSSEVQDQVSLALTIYSDFGLVKDVRTFAFDKGESSLNFEDVATTIQSQTVTFKPLQSNTSIRVYEQNYEYNLASKYGLLKKYLNKEVTIQVVMGQKTERVTGVLLAYQYGFMVKTSRGVSIYDDVKGVHLSEMPEGFLTLPTLVWKVYSPSEVQADCMVAYRATGFSWKADYLFTLNENETKISLSGWVTIDNNSGKKYADAKIKLIAGDVNVVNQYNQFKFMRKGGYIQQRSQQQSFKESSFSDYHMYTLQRRVTLNQNSQKQIEFIPNRENISIRKFSRITVNTGGYPQSNIKADSAIEFHNSQKNKLGIALPKGTVRAFKSDSDGSLEFVGQDKIDHTPREEKIKLTIGKTFDIAVEKKIVKRESGDNWHDAEVIVEIRNHKDKDAEVELKIYNSYGDNLEMNWSSPIKLTKKNANENIVSTKIGAGQKVEYRWSQRYRRS